MEQSNLSTNPIQEKIDALVKEREEIFKEQEVLKNKFDQYNMRLCEINGSIQTLVELFGSKKSEENISDTEDKANTESGDDER